MAGSHTIEVLVNRTAAEVYNILASQSIIDDMSINSSSPEQQVLTFITPSTSIRKGQSILIALFDSGQEGTLIRVLSRNIAAGQIVDGGKNQQNCYAILKFIEATFRSPEYKSQTPQDSENQQTLMMKEVHTLKKNKGCLKAFIIGFGIIIAIIIIRVIIVEMGLN